MGSVENGPAVGSFSAHLATPAPRLAGLLAVAIGLLAGCADSRPSESNDGEPVSPWDATLVASIGSVDGPDDALSRVGQVLIGPDSTLVVSQPTARLILVYDWRGQLVRQIGQSGEGPGEFGAIRAIGILGDTLYVSDHALDRVSYFDLEGEFVRSRGWEREVLRFSDEYFFSTTPPQVLRDDGTAVLQPSMGMTPTDAMGEGINAVVYRTPYFHVGADSRIIDTVAWRETRAVSVGVTKNGKDYFYPWPFKSLPSAGILPDGSGVVVVEEGGADNTSGYRVVKLGPAGDTVFARTFVTVPEDMPETHRDQEFERIAELYLRDDPDAPSPAEVRRAFIEVGFDVEAASAATELALGHDGSIWVRREPGAPGSVAMWDVLESESGRLEGRVTLPEDELVADAGSDHVVTVGTGNLGVPIVSLYRVHR